MAGIICMAAMVLAVFFIWIILYDTHRFVVVRKQFFSPKIKKKQRYIMLSDLHGKQYGKDNSLLLAAIRELEPDGILIAGDMITALKNTNIETTVELLQKLKESYPVYYANGNHEQKIGLYPDRYGNLSKRYVGELKKAGIVPLVNARTVLPECGVEICGAEIGHDFYRRFEKKEMPEGYMESLLQKKNEALYTILLAHNPEYFPEYAGWGADLVLSGHVHGGILRLPFLGGVISPSMKLFPKYDGGTFREGKSTMVLGRGIGTHSPDVRIFNPGELIVVELFPGEPDEKDNS